VETRSGRFPYVTGCGPSPVAFGAITLFRGLEVASRIGTLAILQEWLQNEYPENMMPRIAMAAHLIVSASLLAVLGCGQPRHLHRAATAMFAFPGPLLSPPWAKVSITSSAVYYTFRACELVAAWGATFIFLGLMPWRQMELRVSYCMFASVISTAAFFIALPLVLLAACKSDIRHIQLQVCSQLKLSDNGRFEVPQSIDGKEILPVLRAYGLNFAEGQEMLIHDGYTQFALVQTQEDESLDGSTRECTTRSFRGLHDNQVQMVIETLHSSDKCSELDISKSKDITAVGWKRLLHGLTDSKLRVIALRSCNLDAKKVDVIVEALTKNLTSLESVDLSGNAVLSPDSLKRLLGSLRFAHVETLLLQNCALDAQKIEAVSERISLLTNLRSLDLSYNDQIGPSSWQTLIASLSNMEMEDLILRQCLDDDEQAEAVLQSLVGMKHLRALDLSSNVKVSPGAWHLLLRLVQVTQIDVSSCSVASTTRAALVASMATDVQDDRRLWIGPPPAEDINWTPCFSETKHVHSLRANLELLPEEAVEPFFDHFPVLGKVEVQICTLQADVFPKAIQGCKLHTLTFLNCKLMAPSAWKLLMHGLIYTEVTNLSFDECNIDNLKATAIAEELASLKNLRMIGFPGCRKLSAEVWDLLLNALCHRQVEELRLDKCRLNDEKIEAIIACLPRLKNLRSIDLSWNNKLSGQALGHILEELSQLPVEKVDVRFCGIVDTKVGSIVTGAQSLQVLKVLDVSGNETLSIKGWSALLRGLSNVAIQNMVMEACNLNDDKVNAITDVLSTGTKISKLTIAANDEVSQNLPALKKLTEIGVAFDLGA